MGRTRRVGTAATASGGPRSACRGCRQTRSVGSPHPRAPLWSPSRGREAAGRHQRPVRAGASTASPSSGVTAVPGSARGRGLAPTRLLGIQEGGRAPHGTRKGRLPGTLVLKAPHSSGNGTHTFRPGPLCDTADLLVSWVRPARRPMAHWHPRSRGEPGTPCPQPRPQPPLWGTPAGARRPWGDSGAWWVRGGMLLAAAGALREPQPPAGALV